MRVLLPLFQNKGKDDTASDEEELFVHDHIDTYEDSLQREAADFTDQDTHQALLDIKAPTLPDDERKLQAVVLSTSAAAPATPPSTALAADPHRKRPTETCATPTNSPKRTRVVAAKKKPPPSYQLNSVDSTKMTAPRFLDEEQQQQRRGQEEVLENEPPPVASVEAAPRNFAVCAVQDGDDEDDPALASTKTSAVVPHDHVYVKALKKRGLEMVEQAGDGNCLFRAVSLQIYGDASMHAEVRERCMDFMAANEEHFGEFVTGETYVEYIARKRLDAVHGNNPEIQAISELYNRPVEVYTPDRGGVPLNIFHEEYGTADMPIRLSYHDGNHYNAVIDPIRPTAGLGLGLPGLQPGLADKQQVASAVMESDQQLDLEKAIKESEQELSQAYDDELQRALKESSESVDYVS